MEIVRSSRSARVNFSQGLWTHQPDQQERFITLPRKETEIRSVATAPLNLFNRTRRQSSSLPESAACWFCSL